MRTPRRWRSALASAIALAVHLSSAQGQTSSADAALRDAVWGAVRPALPFPAATSDDMPVDGREDARWLVRRAEGDSSRVADVVANPLNRENQARAVQAMEDIRNAVTAAERKAQAEYDRARGTTSRQQPTRELNGISIDDEGVAGERADWETRLEVSARQGAMRYEWPVAGPGAPQPATMAGAQSVSVDAEEYDEGEGGNRRRRYRPAETRVYFGTAAPLLKPHPDGGGTTVTVAAAGSRAIEVTLHGQATLIKQVLAQAEWTRIAALVVR